MLEAKLKALRIAAEAGIADVTSRTKEFLHESGWMDDPAASPREPSPPASQPVPSWRSEARAAPGPAADAATAPSWRSEERAAWDHSSTAAPAPSGDPATMRLRRTLAAAREQQAAPEGEDAEAEEEEEAVVEEVEPPPTPEPVMSETERINELMRIKREKAEERRRREGENI